MKKLVHITCKRATYLISKKDEHRLTLLERGRLQFHLAICSYCRLFEKQTKMIGENAKNLTEYKQLKLSDVFKENIRKLLKD